MPADTTPAEPTSTTRPPTVNVRGITISRDDIPAFDAACPGEATLTIDDGEPVQARDVDPATLAVGDHDIEVRCPGETPKHTLVAIVEPTEQHPDGPSAASALLLFLCLAGLLTTASPGNTITARPKGIEPTT